jgi:TP901 family phage tail tape measure protein
MNIQVNVVGARRAQAQLQGVTKSVAAVGAAGAIGGLGRGLEKYGKNLQWVGRQIEFNFTLPLVIAGGVATKWAMDTERAMTRMKKVYGSASMSTAQMTEETQALGRAFRFLSDNMGVSLDQVIDSGAMFAQAGAENIAVANGVYASMQLQILGEMELVAATEAVIAIQAQYGLNSKELTQVIADLNAVENETTVRMSDLVTSFQRGAGVAREAGVSVAEFAGMTASLVPAAGGAAEAGNSLKTVITRVMAPTRQAADTMKALGLPLGTVAWESMNATERLIELAKALDNTDASGRTVALTHIAGRRQVARMAVLLRDLTNENGRYARAMEATRDPQETMMRMQKELDIYLRSSPQGFKILTTQMKNYMQDIGQEILPTVLGVLGVVRNMMRSFAEMDPSVRALILSFLLLLAVIGPIVRYMGAFILMLSQFVKLAGFLIPWVGKFAAAFGAVIGFIIKLLAGAVMAIAHASWAMGAALIGPWGIALVAAGVLIYLFRDQIAAALRSVSEWFFQMAPNVHRAMSNMVQVVQNAVRAIMDAFRALFGFGVKTPAVTAPSGPARVGGIEARAAGGPTKAGQTYLVGEQGPELFTSGTSGTIITAASTKAMLDAKRAQAAFEAATANARAAIRAAEVAKMRADVVAVAPGSGGAFDAAIASLKRLEGAVERARVAYERQGRVVDTWKASLDAANRTLQAQQKILETLRERASALKDQLTTATDELNRLANMPITGMREMGDAIWDNEMAQKRLRLEMLKLQQVHGPVDELKRKLAQLQGDIERLSGKREDLRLAGAGSDVLGAYDQQIDQMKRGQKDIMAVAKQTEVLEDALAKLRLEGEILDLEKSLQFDPLLRQIERLVDGYEEMPFAAIVEAIGKQQAEVARLTKAYEQAEKAVSAQEEVVKKATVARDAISDRYDREREALDRLGESYNSLKSQMQDMQSMIQGFASDAASLLSAIEAAKRAAAAKKKGAGAGAGDFALPEGDFDLPGGFEGLGREEGNIDDLIAEWARQFEEIGAWDIDIFRPIREAWERFKNWVATGPIGRFWDRVVTDWFDTWQRTADSLGVTWNFIKDVAERVWGAITGFFQRQVDLARELWQEMKDDAVRAWTGLRDAITGFVQGQVDKAKKLWEQMRTDAVNAWNRLKDGVSNVVTNLRYYLSVGWDAIRTKATEVWEAVRAAVVSKATALSDRVRQVIEALRTWLSEKWNAIRVRAAEVWEALRVAVVSKVDAVNTRVRQVVEALRTWLSEKWGAMRTRATEVWEALRASVSEKVGSVNTRVREVIESLRVWLVGKWDAILLKVQTTMNSLYTSVYQKFETIKTAFRNAVDAIGNIWDRIRAKLRSPIAAAVRVAVNPIIRGINRVTGLVGIPAISEITIGQYHKGGVVGDGYGMGGTKRNLGRNPLLRDEQLAVLKNGERVLTEKERRYYENDPANAQPGMGSSFFDTIKRAASTLWEKLRTTIADVARPAVNAALRSLNGLAEDDWGRGVVGMGRRAGNAALDWLSGAEKLVPEFVPVPGVGSTGGGDSGVWRRLWAIISSKFPAARLMSGYRPGAITATGRNSYHGMGRAVDFGGSASQMLAWSKWIYANYKAPTRELIYSGRGSQQINNGRDHYYTGITRQNHFDHVHWAMDNGGFLNPGMNPPIYNGLGTREIVTPEKLMRRIVRDEVQAAGGGDRNITFTGDLSFPNVRDGSDAEEFIRNLESMVG